MSTKTDPFMIDIERAREGIGPTRRGAGSVAERLDALEHNPQIQAVLESREPIMTLIDSQTGRRQDIFLNGVTQGFTYNYVVVNYCWPVVQYFEARLAQKGRLEL